MLSESLFAVTVLEFLNLRPRIGTRINESLKSDSLGGLVNIEREEEKSFAEKINKFICCQRRERLELMVRPRDKEENLADNGSC